MRLPVFYLVVSLQVTWAAPTVEFNRDVRPILSDKCFHCHGPDAKVKNIPLRLDIEAEAKAERSGRRAITEGDLTASALVSRITAEKPAQRMPPSYSGLKLSEREIETLKQWIAQGAKWQKHWSFLAPVRHELPAVKDSAWSRNAIDRFILARLEKEDLSPSPEAGRETLLRRASVDATGLPPTPAEIDAFLNDKSPDAYEKAIDRLLASPRYGERMAARWLDAARYADSNGYQFDGERFMWRWRDWVIDAFNNNQPFDRFVQEQIAGDMLPNATREQKVATGFNRNHRANTEDGIIPEEYAVEYVVDRVDTTSTVFLGLTLGCARCHNHKYDPFTQKEFYQIFAFFNNVPELGRAMKYGNSPPLVTAPTAEQQRVLANLNERIHNLEKQLETKDVEGERRAWEVALDHAQHVYWAPSMTLDTAVTFDEDVKGKVSGDLRYQAGRRGRAGVFDGKSYINLGSVGTFDIDDRFTLAAWIYSDGVPDGPVVTRMSDDPHGKGLGLHLDKGKVYAHLTSSYEADAIKIETEQTLEPKRWYHVAITYTGSSMSDGVRIFVDGLPLKTKVLQDNLYRPFRNAGSKFKEPLRIGGGWGANRRFQGMVDEVRVYGRVLKEPEIRAMAAGTSLNEIAAKLENQRTEAETMQLRSYFFEKAADADATGKWKRITQFLEEREKLERTFPTVMVMAERPVRRETHILTRGEYNKPAETVEPGVPAVLPPLPEGARNDRLGFARWLVDSRNPLLARVTVNRFWQMYFGTGLVKTTEDFGQQGEWPSHPELLDWLATEFVRTGWDVKAMQKLILTSAAYCQSSRVTPSLMQRDPENRLLARGPRIRLPAEMVRDQALYAAGLLAEKIGGPSVKPYQPAGLWEEIIMQDMVYLQSKGEDLYRRGLYTFWKRTVAPPMMANFDSAMRESCVVRETRTNTPLQALNLMNDVTFLEAARFIAQRMMVEGGDTQAGRLRYGFRLVLGRSASAEELRVLQDNLNYHRDYFATHAKETVTYLKQGDKTTNSSFNNGELASYASIASMLLNTDEAVTKE